MKRIFISTIILLFCTAGYIHAQFAGKKFISGSAGINFSNINPDQTISTNEYGYLINVQSGKFKSETRASGWNLSHSLYGGKSYTDYNGNTEIYEGIRNTGFGVGRFWEYYKHFNNKLGVFAGPNLSLNYSFTKGPSPDTGLPNTTKANTVALLAGLNAGLYYQLAEKWWITASLGFSNPVSLSYSAVETTQPASAQSVRTKSFNYKFAPVINFPSVGLGFRYFLKE